MRLVALTILLNSNPAASAPLFLCWACCCLRLPCLWGCRVLSGCLPIAQPGHFFESAVLTLLVGGVLMATCRPTGAIVLRRKGAFFLTALAWTVLPDSARCHWYSARCT